LEELKRTIREATERAEKTIDKQRKQTAEAMKRVEVEWEQLEQERDILDGEQNTLAVERKEVDEERASLEAQIEDVTKIRAELEAERKELVEKRTRGWCFTACCAPKPDRKHEEKAKPLTTTPVLSKSDIPEANKTQNDAFQTRVPNAESIN